jgi:ATP-dependent exoDNAse (exonuclease V) beta subunit
LLLGLGESASAGRQAAADGLAKRLGELRDEEVVEWKDVALLFRASTAFSVYEDALERVGIPFVTVAGRGFYDRYEVRDLLNALVAVADPTDDLALVGLLRSPLVGMTDAALYSLRFPPASVVPRDGNKPCAIWSILRHPALPDIVPLDDLARAVQGRELVDRLHEMAGRVPVAALLKQLLDRTYYRAALRATGEELRAQRNVDKLLADAHTSGLASVREFAEYVQTLRTAGARESEAPTEAGSAVQLMTIHKAKGLEFPVVVIADAAHSGRIGRAPIRLDAELGVTVDLRNRRDDEDCRPVAHRLATLRNTSRDEAEDRRLLYVAATRAREKLLVSAHTNVLRDGKLGARGWLKLLGQVAGLDDVVLGGTPDGMHQLALGDDIACRLYPWHEATRAASRDVQRAVHGAGRVSRDLVGPIDVRPSVIMDPKLGERDAQPPRRVWRVVPVTKRAHAPAWVVGKLTHAALRQWQFDGRLFALLRPLALQMGVVDEEEIRSAVQETGRMLRRFQAHPLWAELDAAERWHEVPFSVVEDGQTVNGIIDLLYRVHGDWRIAEFKTDQLRRKADLRARIESKGYDDQVKRYVRAAHQQLGAVIEAVIVFLNVGGGVSVVTVP